MNDTRSQSPDNSEYSSQTENITPSTINDSHARHTKPKFKRAALLVLAFLVGLSIGMAGMYAYSSKSNPNTNEHLHKDSTTESGDIQTSDEAVEDNDEPTPTLNQKTYADPDDYYSFQYPESWSLDREVERNPYNQNDTTEYEKITLTQDGQEVVPLNYPFEMIGCGESTDTESYSFGSYTAKMVDPCGGIPSQAGRHYMILFTNPKPLPSNLSASEWPPLRLVYTPSAGSEQDFVEFAKSFDGLVPTAGYME